MTESKKVVALLVEKKSPDGNVVWRVDKKRKYYEYLFRPDGSQGDQTA